MGGVGSGSVGGSTGVWVCLGGSGIVDERGGGRVRA